MSITERLNGEWLNGANEYKLTRSEFEQLKKERCDNIGVKLDEIERRYHLGVNIKIIDDINQG